MSADKFAGSFEDGVVMVAHHEADGRDLLPKDAA